MSHNIDNLDVLKRPKEFVKQAGFWDLYLLGITIVLGGQFFSWNAGLQGGFWEFFTSTVITGSAYICLVLCMAEMTSAMPFSGGAYGFARVAIGPFWGYMVALCEILQNIFYVTATVIPLGEMLTLALGTPQHFEPLYWILFFVTSIYINISGQKLFWKTNFILGAVSLILLVIYILGSFGFVNFHSWATTDAGGEQDRIFDSWKWFSHLPLSVWFYIGVEMLPLAARDCKDVKRNLPWAMVACMGTLFVTSFFVLFTVSAQKPGAVAISVELMPLSHGFANMFGISVRHATWFSIPATYATGFGFMFAYGRQIASVADSGLLPNLLRFRTGEGKPYAALVMGSVVSLVTTFGIYYSDRSFIEDLFYWSISSSYIVYIFAFLSYVAFQKKYSAIRRAFVNPLGIYSVYYGSAVFIMSLISTLGFQGDNIADSLHPFSGFLTFLGIGYFYYYCIARSKQRFSEEEQKILFSAYVINANMRGKNKLKGRRASTIHIKTAEQHTNAIGMKGFFTRQWSRFSISNKSTASRTTSTVNNLDSISNVNDGADYSDSTFNTTASPSKNHHHELITNKSFVEGHRGHTNIKDMNRKSGCFPSLISEDSTSIPEIPIEQDFTSPKNPAEDDYSIIPEKPVLQCEDSDLECREDGSVKSMVNNFVGTVSSGSGEGKVPKTPMQSRSYGIDESAKGTLQFVPIGHAPSLDYTRGSFLVTNSGATSNNTSSRNDTRYRFSSFLSNAFSFDEGDGTTANTRRRSGFERQSISGKFATKLQNFALHKILPIIDDPEFFTMTEQIILERSRSSDPIAEVDGTIISDVYLNPEEDGSMKV